MHLIHKGVYIWYIRDCTSGTKGTAHLVHKGLYIWYLRDYTSGTITWGNFHALSFYKHYVNFCCESTKSNLCCIIQESKAATETETKNEDTSEILPRLQFLYIQVSIMRTDPRLQFLHVPLITGLELTWPQREDTEQKWTAQCLTQPLGTCL